MKLSLCGFVAGLALISFAYGMDQSSPSSPAIQARKPYDPKNKTAQEVYRETLRRIAEAKVDASTGTQK